MRPRPHGVRQSALEEPIDLSHLASSGNFSIDCAQGGQHILAEVPKCLQVAGETNALRDPLDRVAAMNLKQRQHCGSDLAHLTIRGAARAESGKGQKAEEPAKGHHCEGGVLPETWMGANVKPGLEAAQVWTHHFMFKNNILHASVQVQSKESKPKYYFQKRKYSPWLSLNEKATGCARMSVDLMHRDGVFMPLCHNPKLRATKNCTTWASIRLSFSLI